MIFNFNESEILNSIIEENQFSNKQEFINKLNELSENTKEIEINESIKSLTIKVNNLEEKQFLYLSLNTPVAADLVYNLLI